MRKDDSFIESQAEQSLREAGLLHDADIRVEARNGEITLQGIVDVLAEKWAAGDVVKHIPGVVSVDNSLTVGIDRQPDDSSISEVIREKYEMDPREGLQRLTVTVQGGMVYLQGDVDNIAEEEAAKEIAAGVQGVKDVVSYIETGRQDFATDDATITNAVEAALSRSMDPRKLKTGLFRAMVQAFLILP